MKIQDNERNQNTKKRAIRILDDIDALLAMASSNELDEGKETITNGKVQKNLDTLEQLRSNIARQSKQLEMLISQRQLSNSRMDYLADKIAQLEGAKHSNADDPDFQDCAHSAPGTPC